MILLTLNELLWPPMDEPSGPPKQSIVAMATRLPLGEAILRIKQFEQAHIDRYGQNIRHELQSVSQIEDVALETLGAVDVRYVESLSVLPEEF